MFSLCYDTVMLCLGRNASQYWVAISLVNNAFQWDDGVAVHPDMWMPNEPSNGFGENCARIIGWKNFTLADTEDFKTFGYACRKT